MRNHPHSGKRLHSITGLSASQAKKSTGEHLAKRGASRSRKGSQSKKSPRRRGRLAVSRRAFLGRAAGASTVIGTGLLSPDVLLARDDEHRHEAGRPKAIKVGFGPFAPFGVFIHHLPPLPDAPLTDINEPSNITDFDGFVAFTRIRGGGIGTDTKTGQTQNLAFQADMVSIRERL